MGLKLGLVLIVTAQLKKVLDPSHSFSWVQNTILQSGWRAVVLFKLLWREQASGCIASWNQTGVCDIGTHSPCCSGVCLPVHFMFRADTSQPQRLPSTACLQTRHHPVTGMLLCSTKHQAGSSYPTEFRWSHTTNRNYKMIFTMARQFVIVLVEVACARPSDMCSQGACLTLEPRATYRCSGSVNKLLSLISSQIVKNNHFSDWDPPSSTIRMWLASSVIQYNRFADPVWYLPHQPSISRQSQFSAITMFKLRQWPSWSLASMLDTVLREPMVQL